MKPRDQLRFSTRTITLLSATALGFSFLGSSIAKANPVETPALSVSDSTSAGVQNASDLSNLLPFLLTSSSRKRLATEIVATIRQGELAKAEDNLNAAIEVGTFALALVSYLRDPQLVPTLEKLGISGDLSTQGDMEQGAKLTAACSASSSEDVTELRQALAQEESRNSTISGALNNLMKDYNDMSERVKMETASSLLKASDLQQALQREQERTASVATELANLQEAYRTLEASKKQEPPPSRNPELEALLQQERERGDNAERQLASIRDELLALQSSKDDAIASQTARVAELENALTQTQARFDKASQDLAKADEKLRTLQEAQKQAAQNRVPPPQETTSSTHRAGAIEVAALPDGVQPLSIPPIPPDPGVAKPAPVTEPKTDPALKTGAAEDRLTTRADELFRKGDVSGARLLLEHSLQSGNGRAAFLLAETFDPHVLSKLGTLGIRGDAAKAREFYAQAQSLGIPQAKERLEALK